MACGSWQSVSRWPESSRAVIDACIINPAYLVAGETAETVLLAQSNLERAASQLATPERAVEAFFIEASFDAIDDPKERLRFKGMPTSFVLSDEQIDALRGIGRQLLRDSPEFQKLIASF